MAQALQRKLASIDVSDPRLYREDSWRAAIRAAAARRSRPLLRGTRRYGPYWSVTRYADIMKVELDHGPIPRPRSWAASRSPTSPRARNCPTSSAWTRRATPRSARRVAPIVAPTNLANMEATDPQRTRVVLDGLPRNQPFDWVDRVSTELTAMMLATLFDFPWDDRRKLT